MYFAEDPRYAGMYAYEDGLSCGNADGSVVGGDIDNLPEQTGKVLVAVSLPVPRSSTSLQQGCLWLVRP